MPEDQGHVYGNLESVKFSHRRKQYYEYVGYLKSRDIPVEDSLHDFTAYVGQ